MSRPLSEQRDSEVERTAGRKMGSPFAAKVVGVSFVPGYPDNILHLGDAYFVAEAEGKRLSVTLARNPDNEYDENAIEVHVKGTGMIGHLTRPIAARLAPELDAGQVWLAQVETVLINPDHMDRPGISINCKRGD